VTVVVNTIEEMEAESKQENIDAEEKAIAEELLLQYIGVKSAAGEFLKCS
jgi:hypothetical protein